MNPQPLERLAVAADFVAEDERWLRQVIVETYAALRTTVGDEEAINRIARVARLSPNDVRQIVG